ncbi:response regulator [Methylobacterium planeticum]|uniref:Response regulator n=1 Tax=Methylobacterium planeticum TaxID=2615211 RepID=A0A6N6MWY5_9HYPH|nr:response regulator [Methylobacterium planeticum]KAB1074400.1 response regulator [Methylobacterium planeticum]
MRCADDLRAAALIDETIAFELNAAAAYFDRQGSAVVAEALRDQAETLRAEALRLQDDAARLFRQRAADPCPTVLLVEDEVPLLKVVTDELEDAGFHVLQAGSYEVADLLLRSPATVDLLLTDIRLPSAYTGWDVAERARSRFPNLPVIYVTGYSVEAPRRVEGSMLMMKPYRPSALLSAMQQLGVVFPA